jgi:hypothetical protein
VAFTSVVQLITADDSVIEDAVTAEITGPLDTVTDANAELVFPAASVATAAIE